MPDVGDLPVPDDGPDSVSGAQVEKLVQRILDSAAGYGITRLADLTGLDSLGVPVWSAIRPNSRSLSATQGKGLTHAQARISALMEALEQHYAERDQLWQQGVHCSHTEARRNKLPVLPFKRAAGCLRDRFDPDFPRYWIAGSCLFTGREVYAPYELVGMDYRTDAPWDRHAFRMSSVGLAGGATRAAAITHALCEVIENSATALTDSFGDRPEFRSPLALGEGDDPSLTGLIARLADQGVEVRFHEVQHGLDLPVIGAVITAPFQSERGQGTASFMGYACRPCPSAAARAALLEALQSKLTDIAGAREDIDPVDYTRAATPAREDGNATSLRSLVERYPAFTGSDEAKLESLLNHLRDQNVRHAYIFDLGGEELGIQVVRLLAPGFENTGDDSYVNLGARGLAALLQTAG